MYKLTIKRKIAAISDQNTLLENAVKEISVTLVSTSAAANTKASQRFGSNISIVSILSFLLSRERVLVKLLIGSLPLLKLKKVPKGILPNLKRVFTVILWKLIL
jgi:hypothetical protein